MKINLKKLPVSQLLTASAIALALASPSAIAAQAKHVSVAPENMQEQKLASPSSKGLFSHSTMLPINGLGTQQQVEKSIYFDGQENTPLILMGPDIETMNIMVVDPSGKVLRDESKNPKDRLNVESISMGQKSFKGKQLMLSKANAGKYKVTLSRSGDATQTASSGKTQGFLMVKGDPSYKLYSYLDNNLTVQNSDINIIAHMVDSRLDRGNRQKMLKKSPLHGTINEAFATITTPDKQQIRVELRDDGLKGDKIAGDGLYSAKVPTSEVGVYTSQVQVQGVRPDGISFSRTATDLYPIEKANYQFAKSPASLKLVGDTKALVSVPVKTLDKPEPIYLAAEVWGSNKKGTAQSAAWVGGVVSPDVNGNLELSFDTRWLTRAKLNAPFSLKSLRLQTVDTNVPIAELNSMPINTPALLAIESAQANGGLKTASVDPLKITNDMLMGNAPISNGVQIQATSNPKLLLVHGYCSGNVWNASNFTNAAVFQDLNQNRSHEEFAQRVINFGAPYTSYGIVAHSQGGAAALHMYSRYWTGLDYATGGRIIQSVGTPYRGTALAGSLAAIGDIFGIGCGTNTDLTYSGASNWLATIPSWARAEVDYYTTSFTDVWWRYDYCHLGSDLLLDDPEDGTTERWAGQLSGGVNKGHKTGWCHTTGMRDAAQYYDSSRNSSMNSRAAR